MRKKSPTSAWRRSISSTRKASERRGQRYNWPGQEVAAADTAAAVPEAADAAAGTAAEVVAEVVAEAAAEVAAAGAAAAVAAGAAGAGAAAACRGEVAASARRQQFSMTLINLDHQGRVRSGSAQRTYVSFAAHADARVSVEWWPIQSRNVRLMLVHELGDGGLTIRKYALHWRPELWRRCAY